MMMAKTTLLRHAKGYQARKHLFEDKAPLGGGSADFVIILDFTCARTSMTRDKYDITKKPIKHCVQVDVFPQYFANDANKQTLINKISIGVKNKIKPGAQIKSLLLIISGHGNSSTDTISAKGSSLALIDGVSFNIDAQYKFGDIATFSSNLISTLQLQHFYALEKVICKLNICSAGSNSSYIKNKGNILAKNIINSPLANINFYILAYPIISTSHFYFNSKSKANTVGHCWQIETNSKNIYFYISCKQSHPSSFFLDVDYDSANIKASVLDKDYPTVLKILSDLCKEIYNVIPTKQQTFLTTDDPQLITAPDTLLDIYEEISRRCDSMKEPLVVAINNAIFDQMNQLNRKIQTTEHQDPLIKSGRIEAYQKIVNALYKIHTTSNSTYTENYAFEWPDIYWWNFLPVKNTLHLIIERTNTLQNQASKDIKKEATALIDLIDYKQKYLFYPSSIVSITNNQEQSEMCGLFYTFQFIAKCFSTKSTKIHKDYTSELMSIFNEIMGIICDIYATNKQLNTNVFKKYSDLPIKVDHKYDTSSSQLKLDSNQLYEGLVEQLQNIHLIAKYELYKNKVYFEDMYYTISKTRNGLTIHDHIENFLAHFKLFTTLRTQALAQSLMQYIVVA